MKATEVLTELARRGVSIRAVGGKLRLRPAGSVDDAILTIVRQHKPEVLAELQEAVYRARAEAALRAFCTRHEPGTILWLDKNAPSLYEALTIRLPDEISRLWDARAPIEQFDAALRDLAETHRQAVALYRASLTSGKWPKTPAEDKAGGAAERACQAQPFAAAHEARQRGRKPGLRVQHRNDRRHGRTARGRHQHDSEPERDPCDGGK
jgi:hypothetical protein